ncbi:MAG: hypothetical protein WCD66_09950 [Rhodanobacteraceae bacterium]
MAYSFLLVVIVVVINQQGTPYFYLVHTPEMSLAPLGGVEQWQDVQFHKDAFLAYKLILLKRIGARVAGDSSDQHRMDSFASEMLQRHPLSDRQVGGAQTWAEQTYQQYFAGHPWLGGSTMSLCVEGN